MESFFSRFRNPLVLIVVVMAQIIALAVQVQRPVVGSNSAAAVMDGPDQGKTMLLRRWTVAIVTPFERLLHGTGLGVRHLWSNYGDLRHARERNVALEQEVSRLRQEQASFAEDAAQGRRLQALLGFKEQYITKTVAAQVIGTSGTDRSHTLWIDKGSADGIKPQQAVITPDGVVGKIRDVFPHTSQLLLLSDPTSGAGVVLETTRMRGIVRGNANGQVQINNLTADERIKTGEKVLTSGGDQVFPRGLAVGVIESINPDPQHQPYTAITIKPTANLTRLEEVLVIISMDATPSHEAKQDADVAEATAEENKRAADVIAEKLPSLHEKPLADDKSADAATDASKPVQDLTKAKSGPVRTQPAVHPDRYSPGTIAPAKDLKPGGIAAPPAPPDQPKEQ